MDIAKVAAALADPVRVRIIQTISLASSLGGRVSDVQPCCPEARDGVCVCGFSNLLRISQPRASYHLRILKEAGLVYEKPRGKWSYYALNEDTLSAFCRELQSLLKNKEVSS